MRGRPREAAASLPRDCESLDHVLFEGRGLTITRKRCLRRIRHLSREEQQPAHVMIFPISGVNVLNVGDRSYVVDPSSVTLCNAGEVYRVGHPHGSGEATIEVAVDEPLLLGALQSRDALRDPQGKPFGRGQVGRSARLHLELLELVAMCSPRSGDPIEVEERVLGLVDSVAASLVERERQRQPEGRGPDLDLAEAAATLLAARFAAPLSLDTVAESLGVTKFRLCRAFKRVSGETVWERVQQLRSRRAAAELLEGDHDLTDLALALGFSSHSHFTACFRRVFGATPSAFRERARAR